MTEPFAQFHQLELNQNERITQTVHSHPIYAANLLNIAFHPNPGYCPETFNLSQPTVLGQQNLLAINNDRFPHPYIGNPFFIIRARSLPLSHVSSDYELPADAHHKRIRLSDANPIITYLNQDTLNIFQHQLYLQSHAPARPNTPVNFVITDPIPKPPLYEDAPSHETARATTSRHLLAVLHQQHQCPEPSRIIMNLIDPPPTIDDCNYTPSFHQLNLFTHEDFPSNVRPFFLLESIIVYLAALTDSRILTFLIHPEHTLDSHHILDHLSEILILDINHERTPLPYLPGHWLKYHSETTFHSLTHDFNFTCFIKFCPFNIAKYITYDLTNRTTKHLTALAFLLSMQLFHLDHSKISEYFALINQISIPEHYLTNRSTLFYSLYHELSSFFTQSEFNILFGFRSNASPLGD